MNEIVFKIKNYIFRNNAFKKYENLLLNDDLSITELHKLNWEKRKKIVNYAYENIPFYREFYNKHNFHPKDLKTSENWNLIPIISKDNIRNNYNNFINPRINTKRHVLSSTGGTSGIPLKVLHDKHNYNDVNGWRVMSWWNLPISPNIAFVFRTTRNSRISKVINKLLWYPTNRIFLDATNVTEKKIKQFIFEIQKNRTLLLQGYTGALYEVANYVIKNNITLPSITSVWCTSSPLTNNIRLTLKQAFNAEVYDQYGSGEVYWIATECSNHSGLHIHSDIRHVDIVDDENNHLKEGSLGNIIVTDLDNYLFPIIKYKNGDLSLISKDYCDCKRPYPLLTKIYGRVTDIIKLPNGGFIAGDYFTTIFDDYPDEINAFQIHQNKDYSIDINVETNSMDNSEMLNEIRTIIDAKTESKVELRVNVVEKIDNTIGGKSRFVISDIS